MQAEKDKLKKELLSEKQYLMMWAILSLPRLKKMLKCSGDRTKGVAGHTSAKEIRGVTHGSSLPTEQKPGTEMGIIQKR